MNLNFFLTLNKKTIFCFAILQTFYSTSPFKRIYNFDVHIKKVDLPILVFKLFAFLGIKKLGYKCKIEAFKKKHFPLSVAKMFFFLV